MDEFSNLVQIIPDLTLTAMLFWAWTQERRDHAKTKKTLNMVHARHKKDLRESHARPPAPPAPPE